MYSDIKKLGYSDFLTERYLKFFGEEALLFVKAQENISTKIRVNRLKIEGSTLKERLENRGFSLKKLRYYPDGFEIAGKYSPGATPEYLLGYYFSKAFHTGLSREIMFFSIHYISYIFFFILSLKIFSLLKMPLLFKQRP